MLADQNPLFLEITSPISTPPRTLASLPNLTPRCSVDEKIKRQWSQGADARGLFVHNVIKFESYN